MTGGNNWVDAFAGTVVKPSQVSYEALTIAANTSLAWPTETNQTQPYVASQIDVTASASGLSILMPDALNGGTGQACVMTNIGSNSFTLTDMSGNQIAVLAPAQSWLITLTDNSTANGSWRAIQMGATTSNAQASALAGSGLQASGTQLQTQMPTLYVSVNTLLTASYRANAVVYDGSGAATLQLDTSANLTNGWWAFVINEGGGALTISASNSQTINGIAEIVLPIGLNGQFFAALIVSDGTNFNAFGLVPSPVQVADGGTGATTPENALINLGGTTVGINIFTAPTVAAVLSILGINQSVLTESTVSTNVNPAANGTSYVATAPLTITLPLSTGLTKSWVIAIYAQGGAVTVTPQSTDKINNGSAGASYTVSSGGSAFIATDAAGNFWPLFAVSGSPGTVTSVGLADGSSTPIFVISGSPITTTGTLTATLATQGANTVLAGPTSGSAAQPTFRALVTADIPSGIATGVVPTGTILPTSAACGRLGASPPSGYLWFNGQAVSRTTYATLFGIICPSATCTISVSSPGIVTLNNHGFLAGDPVAFETTGTLPTGLAVDTTYYVVNPTTNSFEVAATVGGTPINTTGSSSGTQTCFYVPYSTLTSTTFTVGDGRGRVLAGADAMGGSAAGRLGSGNTGGITGPAVPGANGGEQSHTLTTAEQANTPAFISANPSGASVGAISGASPLVYNETAGFGGGAHNNTQPALVANYIIKT